MAKASIFIVEDSALAAFSLKQTLEYDGFTVVGSCDSGEKAIAFVESTRPDLVLMDIVINGQLDGIQVASILKKRYNVPSVFLTGLTDRQTIDRAKVSEAYGYLTKPFEAREVIAVIEMALYKHDIELQLRRSEEKYFSTVSSISDAVVTVDRDCRITFMNPAALRMTGWTASEVIGSPVAEILNCRDTATRHSNINPIQCSLGMGNLSRMPDDLLLVCKIGNVLPIGESSLSPLLDSYGNFTGLIIVFKNVADKVQQDNLRRVAELNRKAAVIEGQEQERGRIAMDLHDGLGQMLNAIKMNTRVIVNDPVAAQTLLQLLDEAILESVRISENLLPSKLRDFDLATCLRTLCTTVMHSSNVRIDFQAHGVAIPMTQSNKVNFFRITQEALNNSLKHARAKSVSVQLNVSREVIRLTVEDDGKGMKGFSQDSSNGGNGLNNMRDRAEIMGGQFNIESDQHRGTLVTVEVPNSKAAVYV
ncbi:MAG: response regulator [Chryseolinea sp.]